MDLTPDIIRDCFDNTPDIGMQDLISQSVSFVAQKPGSIKNLSRGLNRGS